MTASNMHIAGWHLTPQQAMCESLNHATCQPHTITQLAKETGLSRRVLTKMYMGAPVEQYCTTLMLEYWARRVREDVL